MPLLQKPLRARDHRPHIFRDLNLGAGEALEGDHLLAALQPPLDNFPLAAGRYACHFFDLRGRVPLLVHCI